MLVPAPYEVPVKKAKKKATGTQKNSRHQVLSDSSSDDSEADSSREDEEEEKEASPPAGGEKKRKVAPSAEAGGSKKGRTLPPDYSTNADDDHIDLGTIPGAHRYLVHRQSPLIPQLLF